ncbi:MAG TPA: hypothetical protein VK395_02060 [Gemmataceae bacterium]|nr:hypothetical protein [Gemmataceae bacterium]
MTLADFANIALIVAGVAAATSVLVLFREVRENNKLAKAANTQSLVELSSPFYMGLIHDRQMAELFLRGREGYAEMDNVDKYRYRHLLIWWLVFHENIYYQFRKGLLDQHSYKPWAEDLKIFSKQQNLRSQWEGLKSLFQDDFSRHLEQLLNGGPRAITVD